MSGASLRERSTQGRIIQKTRWRPPFLTQWPTPLKSTWSVHAAVFEDESNLLLLPMVDSWSSYGNKPLEKYFANFCENTSRFAGDISLGLTATFCSQIPHAPGVFLLSRFCILKWGTHFGLTAEITTRCFFVKRFVLLFYIFFLFTQYYLSNGNAGLVHNCIRLQTPYVTRPIMAICRGVHEKKKIAHTQQDKKQVLALSLKEPYRQNTSLVH